MAGKRSVLGIYFYNRFHLAVDIVKKQKSCATVLDDKSAKFVKKQFSLNIFLNPHFTIIKIGQEFGVRIYRFRQLLSGLFERLEALEV